MFKRSLQKPLGKYMEKKGGAPKSLINEIAACSKSVNTSNIYSKTKLIKEMQFARSNEKMMSDLN